MITPRKPMEEKPFATDEETMCKCGAPLIRHMQMADPVMLDQTYDRERDLWVETELKFQMAEYVYSCSVCHMRPEYCPCKIAES